MLILILIDVQYLHIGIFSSEKSLNGPIHSSDSHHPTEKLIPAIFPIPIHLAQFGKLCWVRFM